MESRLSPFDPQTVPAEEYWDRQGSQHLENLLASDGQLEFSSAPSPRVSIIVVLHNKAHLTFLCLDAIRSAVGVPYELIIIDNASTDSTSDLLSRCVSANVVRNERNLGFG